MVTYALLLLGLDTASDEQCVVLHRHIEVLWLQAWCRKLDHILMLGLIQIQWHLRLIASPTRPYNTLREQLIHCTLECGHFLEWVPARYICHRWYLLSAVGSSHTSAST